jgi:hypothetical protein
MRWLGVFIAPNHFLAVGWLCCRWAHQTVRWHTGQSLYTVRFGAVDRWIHLSFCCTGQSGATLDSPVTSDFYAALFATVHFYSRPLARREPLLRWLTGQSGATPDSPVNYNRARLLNSREWHVHLLAGLVHRTVSGAPFSSTLSSLAPNQLYPQLNFFLGLCWTLCTWDKWYLDKLVSPRGLCCTPTTKIDYRKWLTLFPFHEALWGVWKGWVQLVGRGSAMCVRTKRRMRLEEGGYADMRGLWRGDLGGWWVRPTVQQQRRGASARGGWGMWPSRLGWRGSGARENCWAEKESGGAWPRWAWPRGKEGRGLFLFFFSFFLKLILVFEFKFKHASGI